MFLALCHREMRQLLKKENILSSEIPLPVSSISSENQHHLWLYLEISLLSAAGVLLSKFSKDTFSAEIAEQVGVTLI